MSINFPEGFPSPEHFLKVYSYHALMTTTACVSTAFFNGDILAA